jgi:hypothetical protein
MGKTDLEAVIVGAGLSGIASACRLQMDLGLHDFKIFEKSDDWGGTWHLNQYPGCGCDIPTRKPSSWRRESLYLYPYSLFLFSFRSLLPQFRTAGELGSFLQLAGRDTEM